MGGDVNQRAIIVLAVNFDNLPADFLQQGGRYRLVVDEGAGAAISKLHAAQNHIFIVGNGIVAQRGARRMVGGQLQHGDHLAALLPAAHQRRIATPAQRQSQRIKQDGFTGAGLTGQHGHAAIKRQIKLVDKDDVANRERVQHARTIPKLRVGRRTGLCSTHVIIPTSFPRKRESPFRTGRFPLLWE
ncbi:hypothetical protein D9M68_785330 [compost metagenome]